MSDIVERFNLSIHLGPTVVGEIRALEERIVRCGAEIKRLHNLAYAPDGKEMRKALFEEAEKRGNAEAEITRLRILVETKLWQPIETAPKDFDGEFILVYCPEDNSRWLVRWQGRRWYGVDAEHGLTREGYSAGDPDVVTGWAVTLWQPLPARPITSENST